MLRDLTGSVVVLPTAAESPGLAGVMPDPFLQPFRGKQLQKEVEGKAPLLCPLPQSERGEVVPGLGQSTVTFYLN